MSPIPILLLFSILYFSLFSNPPPSAAAAELAGHPPTAYDLLRSYGFPVGILPIGVKGYDLYKSTGKFNLYLNKSCSFSLEGSYQLKYKSVVSGFISKNKLANISGVSVKVLFLGLNIVEVDRSDDEIDFSVGIAGASFPIENFLESPQCGCGFDCDFVGGNGLVRKMKFNPFVNSV